MRLRAHQAAGTLAGVLAMCLYVMPLGIHAVSAASHTSAHVLTQIVAEGVEQLRVARTLTPASQAAARGAPPTSPVHLTVHEGNGRAGLGSIHSHDGTVHEHGGEPHRHGSVVQGLLTASEHDAGPTVGVAPTASVGTHVPPQRVVIRWSADHTVQLPGDQAHAARTRSTDLTTPPPRA